MKHHLHLLLAAGFGAMSIGAAAAVHDWTATRFGLFDALGGYVRMNNAGQVVGIKLDPELGIPEHSFLYTPGTSGGLVDLGSLGGTTSVARALNQSGQVTGWSTTADGFFSEDRHPFVYRDGRMQRLSLPGETYGYGHGINDHGEVVTESQPTDGFRRGVIFRPAGPPTVLSIPGRAVEPVGINNRGQVFGNHFNGDNGLFFYDKGRMIDIGRFGGGTFASDMNASGHIVGMANDRPFLYSDGKMTDLRPGNRPGQAVDINDQGQVLGVTYSTGSLASEGFLYSDGQVQVLAGLTQPGHLNELRQVVGLFGSVNDEHAFFYSDDDGRTTDLTRWLMNSFHDVAGVALGVESIALNDLGQIAIPATLKSGQQTIFVLTPIPEPSTYALILSGLGVLAWIARRQRGQSTGNRADQTPQTGLAA